MDRTLNLTARNSLIINELPLIFWCGSAGRAMEEMFFIILLIFTKPSPIFNIKSLFIIVNPPNTQKQAQRYNFF